MKNITNRTATYFAKELIEFLDDCLPSGCVLSGRPRSCNNGMKCDEKQKKKCDLSMKLRDATTYC